MKLGRVLEITVIAVTAGAAIASLVIPVVQFIREQQVGQ